MQFAINYSPQAEELLASGQIDVDRYKCPEWPTLVQKAQAQRPVYIHFPLMAGRSSDKLTLDEIESWLNKTGTRYVNTHLAPRGAESPDVETMIERMVRDVEVLTARFGPERVIVENAPMPDPPPWDIPVVPVAAMCAVVEAAGCGFLLDIAHAVLTCERAGWDVYDYMDSMPVHRLRELHITGIGLNPQGVREDHLPMTDDDWPVLEWALARIRSGKWATPYVMAFEYGGIGQLFEWRSRKDVLAAQVPRLYELAHSIKETAL